MNVHKNARLTFEGRKLLIERIRVMGLAAAAEAAGVSLRTARKWLARFEEHGLEGLADRSSRPRRTRSTVDKALERSIEQLRRLLQVRSLPVLLCTGSKEQPGQLPPGVFVSPLPISAQVWAQFQAQIAANPARQAA